MSTRTELFEQALDDFGETVYFYVDGSYIRRDAGNGMWRLYDTNNKNIDNDQYRHDLMERNGLQFPY